MNGITYLTTIETLEELILIVCGLCLGTFTVGYLICNGIKGLARTIVDIIDITIMRFKIKKKVGVSTKSAIYDYRVEENEGNGLLYCNNEYVLACNHYENALMIKAILEDDDCSNLPFNK